METKYVNVVLQGGGVRGVAYAGALAKIPQQVSIRGIGGSSAGAIAAALVAVGYRGDELRSILASQQLITLLDQIEWGRFQFLSTLVGDVADIWRKKPGVVTLARWFWRNRLALEAIRSVWSEKGLHGTGGIRQWLDKTLEGKTFGDVTKITGGEATQPLGDGHAPRVWDLRIVAADVNRREFRVYAGETDRDRPIAEAVQASLSIPIFFRPVVDGGGAHYVDGGTLSNFPSFLFFRDKYPTVGLKLDDVTAPKGDGNELGTWDYLKGLMLTMLEAHDKQRRLGPYFYPYTIDTNHIPSLKFDLTEDDFKLLYLAGRATIDEAKWLEHAATNEVEWSDDPQPEAALALSLRQAEGLYKAAKEPKFQPEVLEQTVVYTARIEDDWSVAYLSEVSSTVRGARPLVFGHWILTVDPDLHDERFGKISIAELDFDCVERLGDGESIPVARLPAFNMVGEKGFLLVYNPPIVPNAGPRTIVSRMRVEREFATSVDVDKEGEISYSIEPRALQHHLRLRFRVEIDTRRGQLQLNPSDGLTFRESQTVADGEAAYRAYEAMVDTEVKMKLLFTVKVRK